MNQRRTVAPRRQHLRARWARLAAPSPRHPLCSQRTGVRPPEPPRLATLLAGIPELCLHPQQRGGPSGHREAAPRPSFKQGPSLYLSCRSWLKSGLGWHWLPSWEAEASVVRLRAGGSAAAALLNWGVRVLTGWPLPCIICELLIGRGPWSNGVNEKGKISTQLWTHLSRNPPQKPILLPTLALPLT